ncbi:diguanylate cyclase (GGDEF)-like protein [Nakamurella sp. UYEF19]|uniref:putative bifunctional diguanylate cyclase/phosphodiesterase n=1 Tax=Nakamurella sp. UYEF19 TaxID=1756392 RepID=UPI0033934C53
MTRVPNPAHRACRPRESPGARRVEVVIDVAEWASSSERAGIEEAAKLAVVLAGFAATMLTDFPIQSILDQLVHRIVDVLPVSGAGMTLISDGAAPAYLAGSDAVAHQFEQLQADLNEGPCVLAYQQGAAVHIPDVRTEPRFPRFVRAAAGLGMESVYAFPLRHGGVQIGALDLYTAGPLTESALGTAQILADVASAYLINARGRRDLQDARDRAEQTALHDALTGLPNRILLVDRMENAFRRSRRSRSGTSALFLDLDRLKAVNDTYGHSVGDELLTAVAVRLTQAIRPGDTLARISGDEFVVLCEDLRTPADAVVIANRLLAEISRGFSLSTGPLMVTASIGIGYAAHGAHSCEQLLQEADSAMYLAKRGGGDRLQVFDETLQLYADTQLGLQRDLHEALCRQELRNAYQPIIDTGTGTIAGFEALVRWHHPQHGQVPPSTLIPLAEQSGLIFPLGEFVLQQAWVDHFRWSSTDSNERLTMSVNVSPDQLTAVGFTDMVASLLHRSPVRNNRSLVLEVTETLFIRDTERAVDVLSDLRALGVSIALDDFGTGYSSLSYLDRFPVDVIKIDRSFISHLTRPSTLAIVKAMTALAHDLGITVVAEGVETAEQYRMVNDLGCDNCQGFYFARPVPAREIDLMMGKPQPYAPVSPW